MSCQMYGNNKAVIKSMPLLVIANQLQSQLITKAVKK